MDIHHENNDEDSESDDDYVDTYSYESRPTSRVEGTTEKESGVELDKGVEEEHKISKLGSSNEDKEGIAIEANTADDVHEDTIDVSGYDVHVETADLMASQPPSPPPRPVPRKSTRERRMPKNYGDYFVGHMSTSSDQ